MEQFREIWLVDFEFAAPSGAVPEVRCLVAHEILQWPEQSDYGLMKLGIWSAPPYAINEQSLFVALLRQCGIGCHLALGWDLPCYVLDLFCEFRNLTNGLSTPCGAGLLGALAYFGLDAIDAADKDSMRQLALRGGDYSECEKQALLDYCETDVDALARLLPVMLPHIDLCPCSVARAVYESGSSDGI